MNSTTPKPRITNDVLALNQIANEQFLTNADEEYVAARLVYQVGLRSQFYWHALHAIEKYLKCILLYNRDDPGSRIGNGKKLKDFSHNLENLCTACEELQCINFSLTAERKAFLLSLNQPSHGTNRYLAHSTTMRSKSLGELDALVWEVRLWAQNAPALIQFLERNSGKVWVGPLMCYQPERGHPQIGGCYLERLQDLPVLGHLSGQSEALLTGNAFYIPLSGEPIPAKHRFSSSFLTVADRCWAKDDPAVEAAIRKYIK